MLNVEVEDLGLSPKEIDTVVEAVCACVERGGTKHAMMREIDAHMMSEACEDFANRLWAAVQE